jgi:hypothetical protein
MNIWIAKDGAHWKPYPLEAIPKPVTFPRFVSYPNELPTARAQRWRQTFKELAEKQHDYVMSAAAWALHDAKSQLGLEQIMQSYADRMAAHQDLDHFVYHTADQPLELTVTYKLRGSSKTHQMTLSLLSPSQQEQHASPR